MRRRKYEAGGPVENIDSSHNTRHRLCDGIAPTPKFLAQMQINVFEKRVLALTFVDRTVEKTWRREASGCERNDAEYLSEWNIQRRDGQIFER